ncbi:MAG: cobaltochelatase subunit CobN, partial [Pseudomonadota bacterium]
WAYLAEGGPENAEHFLRLAAHLIGEGERPPAAVPLLRAGVYARGMVSASAPAATVPAGTVVAATVPAGTVTAAAPRPGWAQGRPVAALVFYRALLQGAGLAPVDALVAALEAEGLAVLPVFVASLKDPVSAATLETLFAADPPAVVLNATAFAVATPNPETAAASCAADGKAVGGACGAAGASGAGTVLDRAGVPVLQVIFSGGDQAGWAEGMAGLAARDIAMNVALPEVDGRLGTRAVSFKGEIRHDAATQVPLLGYRPVDDRVAWVARLAAGWARLAATPRDARRVALVLANYPNRDGRLANGVGLDTPASTVAVLEALAAAGYGVEDAPDDAAALMHRLGAGPTNALDGRATRPGGVTLPLAAYRAFFETLPQAVRSAVADRWGPPEDDPFVADGVFRLAIHPMGSLVVGVQPARGYNIDPKTACHSPDLPPPHGYLAFYAWLRETFGAHALVHMGKHGTAEWLPGKAVALSEDCFPEAVLGPLPHLYPFIVNDPGEGTQAKRRAQAVIVDHLTPPLTRAETYGPLAELEALVDEYFEAAGVDPRRLTHLRGEILALTERAGLDRDAGLDAEEDADARLARLDDYLCELKESQIRDGLHVFGAAPEGRLETDLLAALARLPRGIGPYRGAGGDASLTAALAGDLGLGFDPLDAR